LAAVFNLKNVNMEKVLPTLFYAIAGALFLILLPMANFPPHIALIGVMSLVGAYGLYTRRIWAKWLVAILFFVATAMSLFTVYSIALSNWFISLSMIVYAVLTWYFTYYVIIKKL
jgi:uncharacterized membrane protein (DUF2068 family)